MLQSVSDCTAATPKDQQLKWAGIHPLCGSFHVFIWSLAAVKLVPSWCQNWSRITQSLHGNLPLPLPPSLPVVRIMFWKMVWNCFAIVFELLWKCSGAALQKTAKLPWIFSWIAMEKKGPEIAPYLLWECSRVALMKLPNYPEIALKMIWNCSRIAL